jgi:hypothetical protein
MMRCGGSPSALVKLSDGRLALAYIHRSQYGSRVKVRFSSNSGQIWSDEIVLRGGDGLGAMWDILGWYSDGMADCC